ncbi:FG-GAP repeat domain-containing protein [Flagellimonas meishanensis]|uniref:FG-GAP repeat domain-containing protein n=1 Tax=Flagellimonas meishanensis TaxID=2873264 RepID=UPI001CA73F92|nr:VCBS repeat-containing protein [[Muricauda] meishanensis]
MLLYRPVMEREQYALLFFIVLFVAVMLMGFFFLHNPTLAPPLSEQKSKPKPIYRMATPDALKSGNLGQNSMNGEAFDFNGDGHQDLVLAIEFGHNIILINDGQGSLVDESGERFPKNKRDSEDIAMADFDKDGDVDLVFVSEDDQVNEYYRNTGQGYFEDFLAGLPVRGISNVVETADFNEDGYADLIIGNQGQNFLLINNGKGVFLDETQLRLPSDTSTTQDIALGDLDGDGDLDLVEANETSNRILINYGKGHFKYEADDRLPAVNDQTREVELGDLDNDGDLDIFFANVDFGGLGNPQNRLLLNDGYGFFKETIASLPQNDFGTVGATFFDINGDGFLDLINGNRFNGQHMMVLINQGNATFKDQTGLYFPEMDNYTFDFVLADFNGDDLEDIYLCNFRGEDILLIRNE